MLTILTLAAALLSAQETAKIPEKVEPPTISRDLQADYWKENATYHAIDADLQKALKTEAVDRSMLDEQGRKVAAAGEKLRSACGDKHQLDQEQFSKGVITCVAKPPEPVKPKL